MHLSESELYRLIFESLPHSPRIPFVWICSVMVFAMVLFIPWIQPRRFIVKSAFAFLAGSGVFMTANYLVDQSTEHDARLLSKIISEGQYHIRVVDEGEEIEIQGKDFSKKLHLGISHAVQINLILEAHGISFLSLIKDPIETNVGASHAP